MDKIFQPRMSRVVERLISSAIDYCKADAVVASARAQFAELCRHHDPDDGICCIPPRQTDFDSDPPEALPKSKWCSHCRRYMKEAIDGGTAKWERRAARQRMRRAYQQIIAARAPLGDAIVVLYKKGAIKPQFTVSEIDHVLAGVYSDREIRLALAGMVGHHHAAQADERFRLLKKYRYEIVG